MSTALPLAGLVAWGLVLAGMATAVLGARSLAVMPVRRLAGRVYQAAGRAAAAPPAAAPVKKGARSRRARPAGSAAAAPAARVLEQAGSALTASEFLAVRAGLALVAGILALLAVGPLPALVVAAVGALAPVLWLRRRAESRMRAMEGQLADALVLMAAALHAGYALPQALVAASREMPAPLGPYLAEAHRRASLGVPLEDTLLGMSVRLEQGDLALVATAISVQRQVGGNLAEILDGIAETVRDRIQLRQRLRAATAQNRLSATILTLLPVALAFILIGTAGSFVSILWTTRAGLAILATIVILDAIGVSWIRKVGRIDV